MTTESELKRAAPKPHNGETVFRVGPETRSYTTRVACPRCHRAQWRAFEHRGASDGFECAWCGHFRAV